MKPVVRLLSVTQIDWQTFLETCKQELEVMPTKRLDDSGMELDQKLSFILSLAYMQGAKEISELGTRMEHLSYGFLILTDGMTMRHLWERTNLRVTSTETINDSLLVIATGTLKAWYEATLEFCSAAATKNLRLIGDAVVLIFDKAGFRVIWDQTKRAYLKDQTFILEHK